MSIQVVLGGQFGDEGKGLVTDWLCAQSPMPLVIRFNGGHQAGHTVVRDGVRHVFSNFGSGTLVGAPTYWSKFCTVDPEAVIRELRILQEKGVQPKLYVDARCPITTPYDKRANEVDSDNLQHGSCGVGFGATIEREENFLSLTFGDLFFPFIFREKLARIKDASKYTDSWRIDLFLKSCKEIIDCPNVDVVTGPEVVSGRTLVFEGAQGLLLDQHFGIFPHVTRSNTGSRNVLEILKEMGCSQEEPEYYLVTRAYTTRHGNGPMPNEGVSHNILDNPLETNKVHTYQGEFRKGLLDVDTLAYGVFRDEELRKTHNLNVVMTCLNHLQEFAYTESMTGKTVIASDKDTFLRNTIIAAVEGSADARVKKVYLSHGDYGDQIIEWGAHD